LCLDQRSCRIEADQKCSCSLFAHVPSVLVRWCTFESIECDEEAVSAEYRIAC